MRNLSEFWKAAIARDSSTSIFFTPALNKAIKNFHLLAAIMGDAFSKRNYEGLLEVASWYSVPTFETMDRLLLIAAQRRSVDFEALCLGAEEALAEVIEEERVKRWQRGNEKKIEERLWLTSGPDKPKKAKGEIK